MRVVYVVTVGWYYETAHVDSVWSTEAAARQRSEHLMTDQKYDYVDVDEFQLDHYSEFEGRGADMKLVWRTMP